MSDTAPGPSCQSRSPVDVIDGTHTLCPTPAPAPSGAPSTWSFEVGACYAPVSTSLTLSPNEMQVFALLRDLRPEILQAARKHRVTPQAIAGAIAWEALENPRSFSARSVGLGKVHLYNYSKVGAVIGFATGGFGGALRHGLDFRALPVEIEERNYVPKRTYGERRHLLATREGAIEYIAGIMDAIADSATNAGFEDIRNNAPILTNVYQAHTLASWEEYLKRKPPGTRFEAGNEMALWVKAHATFLEEAVGSIDVPERPHAPDTTEKPQSGLEFLDSGSDIGVLP